MFQIIFCVVIPKDYYYYLRTTTTNLRTQRDHFQLFATTRAWMTTLNSSVGSATPCTTLLYG